MGEIWDFGRAPHGARGIFYDPPGTSAKRRSVHRRLGDVVSLKDFGAKIDGTTNTATQVQAAINSGETVLFAPPGTYLIDAALTLTSNLHIVGAGRGRTTFKLADSTNANVFSATTKSNVHLSHLTINGNKANQTAGNGILFQDTTDFIIDDVEVINAFNDGILLDNNCEHGFLGNIKISLPGSHGVALSGEGLDGAGKRCSYIDMARIMVEDPTDSGVNISEAIGCTLNGLICTVDETVAVHSSGYGGLRITNGADNIAASDIFVRNMSRGILMIECFRSSVTNFILRGSRLQGVFVAEETTSTLLPSSDNQFSNGFIYNPGRAATAGSTDGIRVNGSTRNKFSNIGIVDSGANMEYGFRETNGTTNSSSRNTFEGIGVTGATTSSALLASTDSKTVNCSVSDDSNSITSAATITLPACGDVFNVTGTTNITTVNGGWRGRRVTLRMANGLTVEHATGNVHLNGDANKAVAAGETITIVFLPSTWFQSAS